EVEETEVEETETTGLMAIAIPNPIIKNKNRRMSGIITDCSHKRRATPISAGDCQLSTILTL
ncbi:MAG: hypothetical protein ACFE0J_11290, partial [Elainellaceae cyanobacterium]